MTKFHGTFEEIERVVRDCGIAGDWAMDADANRYSFRSKTGEVLNWWPSKGTVQFQGKKPDAFRIAFEGAASGSNPKSAVETASEAKIFVVHGHDRDARDQLELVLMRLGLSPYILQNQDGGSQTIIEALEQNIYREAAFGIVLLTPDDFGYSKVAGETEKQPRARQNVILEMGMVMAALGRPKIAILQKGALERPSDTDGILRIEFNDHVREIVPKLAQRLQAAGFKIDPRRIADASS